MNTLKIDIHSFSYKKGGIPKDTSGNGGGYYFDCRGILNPGRIEMYKSLTGADAAVQNYLAEQTRMPDYLEAVWKVLSFSIDDYLERNFENLQIGFGCTGGQHRSVYAAIRTAEYLKEKYPQAEIHLHHDEKKHLNP